MYHNHTSFTNKEKIIQSAAEFHSTCSAHSILTFKSLYLYISLILKLQLQQILVRNNKSPVVPIQKQAKTFLMCFQIVSPGLFGKNALGGGSQVTK